MPFLLTVLKRIVANNDKKRFEMCPDPDAGAAGELLIRAVQGHGVALAIDSEKALTRVTNAARYPVVVHGIYRHAWSKAKSVRVLSHRLFYS